MRSIRARTQSFLELGSLPERSLVLQSSSYATGVAERGKGKHSGASESKNEFKGPIGRSASPRSRREREPSRAVRASPSSRSTLSPLRDGPPAIGMVPPVPLKFQSGSQAIRSSDSATVSAQLRHHKGHGARVRDPGLEDGSWLSGETGSTVLTKDPRVLSRAISEAPDSRVLSWLYEKVIGSPPLSPEGPASASASASPAPTPAAQAARDQHVMAALVRAARIVSSSQRGLSGHPLERLVRDAIRRSMERIEDLGPDSLALFLWSWARVGAPLDPAHLPRIQAALEARGGDMEPRHLAMVAWSVANMRPSFALKREARVALEGAMQRRAKDFMCSGAASTLQSLGQACWTVRPPTLAALCIELARHSEAALVHEVCGALMGLSTLFRKYPEMYSSDEGARGAARALCASLEPRVLELAEEGGNGGEGGWRGGLKPIDAAQILHSFGVLGHKIRDPQLLERLAEGLDKPVLNAIDLASTLAGLLVQGHEPTPEAARAWGGVLAQRLLSLGPNELNTLEEAINGLESSSYHTYKALATGMAASFTTSWHRLGAVSGARAAATLHALGRIRLYPGPEVVDFLLKAAASDAAAGQVRPDAAVGALWAAAVLRHRPSPESLEGLLANVSDIRLQDASNAAWALAYLGVVPPAEAWAVLMSSAAAALDPVLRGMSAASDRTHSKNLTRLVHALSYYTILGPETFQREVLAAAGVTSKAPPAAAQGTAANPGASAATGPQDRNPSQVPEEGHWAAAGRATVRILQASARILEASLPAEATLPLHASTTATAPSDSEGIAGEAPGSEAADNQEMDDLAGSRKGDGSASPPGPRPFVLFDMVQGLPQVYQAYWMIYNVHGRAAADALIPSARVRDAALSASRVAMLGRQVSPFQKEVVGVLRSMGLACKVEAKLTDGIHTVDVAARPRQPKEGARAGEAAGPRIAVTVDGPTHFSRNSLERLGLRGEVEHSILRALGWRVVSVPFFEWSPLGKQRDAAPASASAGDGTSSEMGLSGAGQGDGSEQEGAKKRRYLEEK